VPNGERLTRRRWAIDLHVISTYADGLPAKLKESTSYQKDFYCKKTGSPWHFGSNVGQCQIQKANRLLISSLQSPCSQQKLGMSICPKKVTKCVAHRVAHRRLTACDRAISIFTFSHFFHVHIDYFHSSSHSSSLQQRLFLATIFITLLFWSTENIWKLCPNHSRLSVLRWTKRHSVPYRKPLCYHALLYLSTGFRQS